MGKSEAAFAVLFALLAHTVHSFVSPASFCSHRDAGVRVSGLHRSCPVGTTKMTGSNGEEKGGGNLVGRRGAVGSILGAASIILASERANALDVRSSLGVFGSDGDATPELSDEVSLPAVL